MSPLYQSLSCFFMRRVFSASWAIFFQFEPIGCIHLVFLRDIVSRFADSAGKNDMFPFRFSFFSHIESPSPQVFYNSCEFYSIIVPTTPAPIVLPPSRMANLSPCSIAIGEINSTSISTLSPGITISTPSGNLMEPVTSVVLK